MSGLYKASIPILALGAEHTGKLFGMMHEDEIRAISATMARIGAVPADAVENLCVDFVKNIGAAGGVPGNSTPLRTLPALLHFVGEGVLVHLFNEPMTERVGNPERTAMIRSVNGSSNRIGATRDRPATKRGAFPPWIGEAVPGWGHAF
jgi:FliG N-terminal domain